MAMDRAADGVLEQHHCKAQKSKLLMVRPKREMTDQNSSGHLDRGELCGLFETDILIARKHFAKHMTTTHHTSTCGSKDNNGRYVLLS
eukprot:scaffold9054_cov137-Skeletonema_marinoi.AAC.2